MTDEALPALSLAAVPRRRKATLDLAREIERRGLTGIYCPSLGDGLALCQGIAMVTERISFGTAIVNLYTRHPWDYAQTAALIQELSGGRFWFGVGVSHERSNRRLGLTERPPLRATREFVEEFQKAPRVGELPPIVLAALRRRMVALSGEIASGLVFANAARSHVSDSLRALPGDRLSDPEFFVANMIPVCISDDRAAAAAVNRRTLAGYVTLPNYRNYWKEAGYVEEMEAVELALGKGERDRLGECVSDRLLEDTTLFGPPAKVLEGLERWYETGLRTPILVPSSAVGKQPKAFEELFGLFDAL